MTLEEAIKHCEEVAEEYEDKVKRWKGDYPVCKAIMSCQKCTDEHRQLAEWLKELNERREKDVHDTNVGSMINRQAAIEWCLEGLNNMPSAQLEIIRCKDCTYGVQDEYGRWYCRSLGCQIGDEDGNGFCSDAERRTDE